ncbi:disease resistance protein RPV1 isoform X2 [Cryptomeria japonica]|uniref:disease resistance protein RPV1 isoform X2 n=1 Tax=Cryptomeria japonica TaxID=3369 RepID=UPI0027DA08E9|nr:disease resistance protein RPV1 isoform X2 [Cryptomeria japonica]
MISVLDQDGPWISLKACISRYYFCSFETRLVKKVVNDLIKTLDKVSLEVAKHPVGINNIKNSLIQKLHLNSANEVVKLGIWGLGGIGKTTIAKALYNQLYAHFEAASFVSNVRAAAADLRGLTILQNQILEESTKYVGTVYSVDKGISLLRERLGGKRVLLVVDDVDAYEQLNALVGDWLGSGSRVIITSRDKHIVKLAQVQYIHEMNGLEINESLELFSWHTFLRKHPSPGYEDLSKEIVKACKGHPLSLEVIGSFLYDKEADRGCWTEALSNITLNPDIHRRVYSTLKISYDDLSDEEKEIFLDIACFFIGQDKTHPIVFWKSIYKMVDTSISNLVMKSLIKIDDKGLFDMHDHLRDMGRFIAKTEKKGTRLWEATQSSTSNFSRIQLNSSSSQRLEMLYSPGRQYLDLEYLFIEGTIEDTLAMIPPSLIWLRLKQCTFAIGKDTAVTQPRHSRFVGNIWQLKIMELQDCSDLNDNSIHYLFSLPNIQLQHLDLGGCRGLNTLPDSIGNLSQLRQLNLGGCGGLNTLPDSIGNLSQLRQLDLTNCGGLNALPDSIGNLSQLRQLDLGWCGGLNTLPDSIGNLSQLRQLNLKCCEVLNALPNSIGNLSQLQQLDLGCCGGLNALPDSIGNLSQLQQLDLLFCGGLNTLPDSIGNLSQLLQLYLRLCEGLNTLPDSIGNLSQLRQLNLECCGGLNTLPDSIGNLSQLQQLDLSNCGGLNTLPDSIGNLSQLRQLDLSYCGGLNTLPDSIGNLSQLRQLDLRYCEGLNTLPDSIGNLSQLQQLDLLKCGGLNTLPDSIGNLSQLQQLDLSNCGGLNTLPDSIGNLSQLQQLDSINCGGLNTLPDSIGNLSQLRQLNLGGCGGLNTLPDSIGNLSQLWQLDLGWCGGLNTLPDSIGNLSQLQELRLTNCGGLNALPDSIGNLSQLQHLYLSNCEGLTILPDGIANLSRLQTLILWGSGIERPHTIGN